MNLLMTAATLDASMSFRHCADQFFRHSIVDGGSLHVENQNESSMTLSWFNFLCSLCMSHFQLSTFTLFTFHVTLCMSLCTLRSTLVFGFLIGRLGHRLAPVLRDAAIYGVVSTLHWCNIVNTKWLLSALLTVRLLTTECPEPIMRNITLSLTSSGDFSAR